MGKIIFIYRNICLLIEKIVVWIKEFKFIKVIFVIIVKCLIILLKYKYLSNVKWIVYDLKKIFRFVILILLLFYLWIINCIEYWKKWNVFFMNMNEFWICIYDKMVFERDIYIFFL